MTSARTLADATPNRTDLRLAVLAQWIRAGLALQRGAAAGRGLIDGAIALWRLAQAVRLAILLARRLAEAGVARRPGAAGPAPTSPTSPVESEPANIAALRGALAELAAAISAALDLARRSGLSHGDREPPGSPLLHTSRPCPGRASHKARGPSRRPHGRRPLRPPGPARPFRRRWRTPGALETIPPPIAPWRSGAPRWLEA